MKSKIPNRMFNALLSAALTAVSAHAAGTDTWVGNTDANWNTAANWTTSGGSTPPASGDSLVFGAAGSSGLTLNNDITSLSVYNLNFNSGASAFTMSGNAITLNGTLTDAASVNESLNGIAIGSAGPTAIKNTASGGGTLALGALTETAPGTVLLTKTSPISTSTVNLDYTWRYAGCYLLGGWAVIDNGNNTYDFAQSGTSGVNNITAAPTSSGTTGNAGNVKYTSGTTSFNVNGSWVTINLQGASTVLNINGTQIYLDEGGIILSGGATLGGSKPVKSNAGKFYVYVPDSGTISAVLGSKNTEPLYKMGPGTLSLNANNTYTGGAKLYAGTVFVGNAGAFGTTAGTLTLVGGNLDCSSGGITLNNYPQAWNADFTFVGTGNLNLGTGAVTLGGTRQVTVSANTLTVGGSISGSGYGLTKAGTGTLKLNGANSYTGLTAVNNGVLLIGNTSQGNGAVTVADGATVGVSATSDATYWSPSTLTVGSSTGGSLQFNLGGTITGPNANTLLTPGALTLNGTTTINVGSCPQVIGSYPLFNGYSSGTLTLGSQPAGLLGTLTVSGSTVYYQLTNFVQDVWTAAVNTNWDTVTANWTNTIGGNKYVSGYPVLFDDAAAGTSPLLVNITNAVTPNSVTVNVTNKTYVIGGLAISGSTGLTKNGTNSLTLTGTNTFTGGIHISAGTVTVGDAGQLGGGNYAGNIDNAGTLNFNSSAAQTISGTISDVGALVQSGSGTLTLPVGNSYSGNTTLSTGTIVVGDNNALGTGTVNLNGGALLDTSAGPTITNNINVMSGGGTIALGGSGGNFTLTGTLGGAGNLTLGGGATPIMSLNLNFSANAMTGGTITIPVEANNQTVVRFNTTATSSSMLDWVINGAPDRGTMLDVNGTYYFGSLAGSSSALFQGNSQSGNIALVIGGNNNSATFSGRIVNNGPTISVSKVGTGIETFAGANTFTGGVNINGGILAVANAGALSSSGPIAFGGGTLQYSSANQVDYSARIANSAGPVSIDLNGTNVTFATALSSSNTNGLMLTNSTGTGILTLTAANSYTGNTVINAGTLALSGSGNIASSTNINIASAGILDVSAVSYTLGGNQTLSGSGTVTGAVATASIGSSITAGGAGTVGTLTFQGNLDLNGGASPVFDLSTSHLGGNDQVVVAGNLTLNSSDTIHIKALSAPANLDTGDYVLFSVSGTLSMATQPGLIFDGTLPANAAHYTLQASGNNVVLHYSSSAVPLITSVVVTNTIDGTAMAFRGQSVTVYVTVVPGSGSISSVTADLTPIGGSASQTLTYVSGNSYSCTVTVNSAAVVGVDTINVTATDTQPAQGYGSGTLTVNASTDTWNGLAGDDNWSSGANWVSTIPPGNGDTVVFAGSTRPTPYLDNNYSVAGLTFDGSASSFTLGAVAGKALTLTGGVTNNSFSSQVINVPIVLNGTQSILDPNGSGNTLAGNISGSGGLTMDASGFGTLTLSGTNTYSGDTTVPSVFGTLYLGSGAAIPNGAGKGNVNVTGTLNLNGYDAVVNGLSGVGYVDNSGGSPVTLSIGNGDTASSFGGLIQNSGGALTVAKVGANVLTMAAVGNTYSGGTTVSAGQITLGASSTGTPVTGGPLGTGTVTLNGGTLQMNAKTLGNNLIVSAGTTNIIDNAVGNSTISGDLSGAGTVTLQNSGSINMSVYGGGTSQDWSGFTGTFKYVTGSRIINFNPGGTVCDLSHAAFYMSGTLNNSTLGIGSGQTVKLGSLSGPSGYMYINAGGALEIGNLNADSTFAGIIQGNGVVTKVGTGTLTLSGANTYTNLTTVSNGTLVVSTTTGANGGYTVVDGATLGVTVAGGGSLKVYSLTFGNSTNAFSGISSPVNPAITNIGALTLAGTVTVNVSGAVLVGQYPLIASASIGGTGGFVVGSLPYGSAANIITNGGNTIVLNVTTGSPPTFEWTGLNNGNWDLATANNWNSNGVSSVYSNGKDVEFDDSSTRTNVVVATNVAPSTVLVTNSTRSYTFAGSGGITGSAGLTKSGNGRLTLANTNSYSGGTIINGGTLQLGDGAANNGLVAGNITDNGSLIFANPLDQTFTGAISGAGSLLKSGAGALTLGQNNPYSGGTTLKAGSVVLPNGAINSFGSGTLTLSNVTLVVKPGGGSSYNSANSVYLGNTMVIPAGTTSTIDNSQNYFGNLWVGGDGVQWTGSGTLNIQNSGSVSSAAVLWNGNTLASFQGTLNIGATGSGTMYVGIGYNSGNGGTGASVATFDASSVACTLDNSGSTLCQVVDTGCTTVKFGSLSASNPGTVLRGNSSSSPANQLTLEVGVLNTSTTFAGVITDWGSAGTALKKVGSGTLTLSGANSYTGNTTINGGTLELSQSVATLATNSTVTIAAGAHLMLTDGTVTNQVSGLITNGVAAGNGLYGSANSSGFILGSGYLQVGSVSPTPTPEPIGVSYNSNTKQLTLSWTQPGWTLEAQTNNLTTGLNPAGWTPVSGAASPYVITVDPSRPTVFYRLANP